MDPTWKSIAEIAAPVSLTLLSCLAVWRLYAASKRKRIRELENSVAELRVDAEKQRRKAEDLLRRIGTADEQVRRLERSLVEMPEIAQRLAVTRDLRQIPERALELVQEIFDSTYSVFYRMAKDELIGVACRGESEFAEGHRVKWGEGIVGWTAVKQLPFTPDDAQYEGGIVRARNLSTGLPVKGFSLCLPILDGANTIGVILVGPSERRLPYTREFGRTIALITSVTITSATVLKQQELLAKTDGLTGLLNKTHILASLRDLIASEGGRARTVSVFLFDIDHFKEYNDTNGHLPGDELLKSLSAFLNDSIRRDELLGRYGGEEFLLIMPGAGKSDAFVAAERVRELIEKHPFLFQENQPGGNLTVSGGVATWPNDGDNLEKLLGCADGALYQAKRGGRNRVCAYSPPDLAMGDSCDLISGEGDLLLIDEEKEDA
jgi:diguanylate cyclase (GGDEF)-like protein